MKASGQVFLIISILVVCLTVPNFAGEQGVENRKKRLDPCGSLEIKPCKTSNYEIPGFECETKPNNDSCLERKSWCGLKQENIESTEHCSDYANLQFSACMVVSKVIDQYTYSAYSLDAPWTLAEQFCQSQKSHLVSFGSEAEYANVVNFLMKFAEDPKNVYGDSDVDVNDPLAHRCWGHHDSAGIKYWTGLYLDRSSNVWKYSDRSEINGKIVAMAGPLSKVLEKANEKNLQRTKGFYQHIAFFDRNYTFTESAVTEESMKMVTFHGRARILCKRHSDEKMLDWKNGLRPENTGCITGFKCSDKPTKCLKGLMFADTSVCNGEKDCDFGDDEDEKNCPFFSVGFPDGVRIAHFLPMKRSPAVAKALCGSHNWSLPSVHSDADIDFLDSIPRKFADVSSPSDFLRISENWKTLKMLIYLGVTKDSETWTDGSKIEFRKLHIQKLMSPGDVYLNTSSRAMEAKFEPPNAVFVICQENRYSSKPQNYTGATDSGTPMQAKLLTVLYCIIVSYFLSIFIVKL